MPAPKLNKIQKKVHYERIINSDATKPFEAIFDSLAEKFDQALQILKPDGIDTRKIKNN